jgi:dipeptidyl aminopeptidase/acylaminoacyl peptidase
MFTHSAKALDISYETIAGISGNNVLILKYGLETKTYYMCSAVTYKCSKTKKKSLPSYYTPTHPIVKELQDKKVNHITLSPLRHFIAYYNHEDSGKIRKLTLRNIGTGLEKTREDSLSYWDLLGDQSSIFEFTPNEEKLIYLDDKEGNLALYQSPSSEFDKAPFAGIKLDTGTLEIHQFLVWDNSTLFFVGNTKENPYHWSLYKYDLNENTQKIIAENVSYTSSLRKVGGTLFFATEEHSGFGPRGYVLKTGKIRYFEIPNVNRKINHESKEVVKVGDRYGVIMKPKVTKSASPLVVWLHGGPYRQSSFGYHPFHSYGIYDSILEAMRAQGAIILKLDYSGSLGFGREYSESVAGNVGEGDVADVKVAVNYMESKYNISKVYLMGNSYGGYLSLKGIVDDSSMYGGALSINGVTDWESLLLKMQTSIFNVQFNGLPNDDNRALYDKASILKYINKLEDNKPVMIIQGLADRTIAPWQAPLLGDKLKAEKKNVSVVTYPGEDHVFAKAKNIRNLCTRMLGFVGIKNLNTCKN